MPRAQVVHRQAAGLYTHPNQNLVPEGALLEAENAVIDREGVLESIKGFEHFVLDGGTTASSDLGEDVESLHEFRGRIIAITQSDGYVDVGTGVWLGDAPDNAVFADGLRSRSSDFGPFALFTTTMRPSRLTSVAADNEYAGVDRPPQIIRQTFTTSGGFIANGKSVSYRATLERSFTSLDTEGIEHSFDVVSAASRSFLYTQLDSASAVSPTIRVYLPNLDANKLYSLKLWRTTIADTTATGDSHYLVHETEISTGATPPRYYDVIDDVIDDFLGEPLYQNPELEGETKGNDRPPYARDIVQWSNHTFYGVDTRREHRLSLRMVDASLISNNETFIIRRGPQLSPVNTETFTAKTTPSADSHFKIFSAGTAQENVRDTTRSLCEAINKTSSVYAAEYISGVDDPAGKILIYARDYEDRPLNISSASTIPDNTFEPPLGNATLLFHPDNQSETHAFYYSKLGESEAVPYFNRFRLPDRAARVLRIAATTEALFIFTDRGIWRLTGDSERDWSLDEHDLSVRILAPDSIALLNDAVYAYTNKGVVRVAFSGVEIISRPIERTLETFETVQDFWYRCFAVGDEDANRYWLWMPETNGKDYAELAYIYNYQTRAWTGPVRQNARHAYAMRESTNLFVAAAHSASAETFPLFRQRSSGTREDYAGPSYGCSVRVADTELDAEGQAVSVIRVRWYHPGIEPKVGWYFEQTGGFGHVTAVQDNGDGSWTLTLDTWIKSFVESPGSSGDPGIVGFGIFMGGLSGIGEPIPATLTASLPMRVVWAPESVKDPSRRKQFTDCQVHFGGDDALVHRLGFRTDLVASEEFVEIEVESTSSWGYGAWGGFPWGGVSRPLSIRTHIPRTKQQCREEVVIYEQKQARAHVEILSMALTARPISERLVVK